ncbi:Squamosa promoter-binding-like protein 14 [Bienertia sinuspersici]
MEDVGTQVASPLFIHQNIGGRFCEGGLIGTKRNLCYNNASSNHNQQQHSQIHRVGHGWNPKDWEWDSSHFLARARPLGADALRLGTQAPAPNNKEAVNPVLSTSITSKSNSYLEHDQQDGNGLRLQLGGVGVVDSNGTGATVSKINVGNVQNSNLTEDPASSLRPNKKVRSGSPGDGSGGGNYPMCQVDHCKEDLSKSKDYHRRHKVPSTFRI